MNQIRQNMLTQQWVIYASSRDKRPHDVARSRPGRASLPERVAQCPFCRGNEDMLADIRMELERPRGGGWQTRVVANKYPVMVDAGQPEIGKIDNYMGGTAYGVHDVVIESPIHNRNMSKMSIKEIEAVIDTYHKRYCDIYDNDDKIKAITIFRNHGEGAGTSLLHPHSQIIGEGMVPEYVILQQYLARSYYEQAGRCIYCDIMKFENDCGVRFVYENDTFMAFVPFWAEVPCEVYIIPKRHCDEFSMITKEEEQGFAEALKVVLEALYDELKDPDYNYILRTFARDQVQTEHLHWYVQVRPRIVTPAGFEIGSGIPVNPSVPEQDAELLKARIEKNQEIGAGLTGSADHYGLFR